MTDATATREPPQPATFEFDAETLAQAERMLARYPADRRASGVLPMLHLVQRQMGRQTGSAWVPRAAIEAVAAMLGMPAIRVHEVATFYLMFNLKPVGRYHLQLCGTTPCWLRGSNEVERACRDHAGTARIGDTSADGMFTLTEVECLGACVNAPILQVNDDYYEDLDYDSTVALLAALREDRPPPVGSVTGRQAAAPEGGPTTLTSPDIYAKATAGDA